MYDKADVFTDDRLFSWIKKLRRLLAGSIIYHILEAWKKEETLDPTEFTIAYRPTEESQIDPSEMPLVLQRLNGDRPRKELPRFVGSVLGFSCAVSGETEDELKINAENKIQSLCRIRRSRGLPDQPTGETAGNPTNQGKIKQVTIKIHREEL